MYFAWTSFISGAMRCRPCIDLTCLSVSGSSSARIVIVSATIDDAPAEPDVVVEEDEDLLEDVDERLEDVGEDGVHQAERRERAEEALGLDGS